MSIRLIFLKIM